MTYKTTMLSLTQGKSRPLGPSAHWPASTLPTVLLTITTMSHFTTDPTRPTLPTLPSPLIPPHLPPPAPHPYPPPCPRNLSHACWLKPSIQRARLLAANCTRCLPAPGVSRARAASQIRRTTLSASQAVRCTIGDTKPDLPPTFRSPSRERVREAADQWLRILMLSCPARGFLLYQCLMCWRVQCPCSCRYG